MVSVLSTTRNRARIVYARFLCPSAALSLQNPFPPTLPLTLILHLRAP